MDIFATDGKFGIGMFADIEAKWNKKDGTLSVRAGKKRARNCVNVTTNSGDFIEVLDRRGTVLMDGGDGQWLWVPLSKEFVTLRFKTLPDPKLSKADIEKARQNRTVHVAHQQRHDAGPIDFGASYEDGTLLRVMRSFERALAKIPEKYRAKARCEIDSESGYEGSHYASVEISYSRPETDAEVIGRVKLERERKRLSDDAKRRHLTKLKAELEPANES